MDWLLILLSPPLLFSTTENRNYYKRPDWFGAVDVPRKVDAGRMSYVIWQEGRSPIIIVELLSPSTLEEDQGLTDRGRTPPSKWEVYESILRVPYYVLFDRFANNFQIFELQGTAYQEVFQDRLWIPALGIGLGLWQGEYAGETRQWLRWYDAENNWILTDTEQEYQRAEQEKQRAEQEQQQAQQERQRTEQERQRAERAEQRVAELAERLRALGIDPEN